MSIQIQTDKQLQFQLVILNFRQNKRPRGLYADVLSLQWHHWFLCEEWGPVTKLSQKLWWMLFSKGKRSWGPSTQWIFVARSLCICKIFGGKFPTPPQTMIWLCATMTFTITLLRGLVQNVDRIPFWTPSGVKKVLLLVWWPKQIIIPIFIPLNFFRP